MSPSLIGSPTESRPLASGQIIMSLPKSPQNLSEIPPLCDVIAKYLPHRTNPGHTGGSLSSKWSHEQGSQGFGVCVEKWSKRRFSMAKRLVADRRV